MDIKTSEGQCNAQGCFDQAFVGLQSQWFCLRHFESKLETLRANLATLNELTQRAQ